MMPSVILGGGPASVQQKGERGGKNAEIDGKRFDEALTGRAGDRKPEQGEAEDRKMETPQDYRIDRYAALFRLDRTGSDQGASDDRTFGDVVGAHAPSAAQEPLPSVEAAPAEEAGDTEEQETAFALLQGLARDEETAKKTHRQEPGTREARDAGNASDAAPGGDDLDGDVQRPAASVSEQQVAGERRASTTRTAEHVPVPPADGQPPARTRTDTQPQVTAAAADKPATTSQPSGQMQPDAVTWPAVAGTAAADGDIARFVSARDGSFAREASPKASAAKPDPVSARVNVLNFTAAPAPAPAAPPVPGTTAASLVAAIEADGTWRAAAQDPTSSAGPRGAAAPAGVNTLRIQLQPAELGMVTARLVASGSQLSVEIQVESNDARQRLANDSEVIVKALRAIGYDVEKVTIQQASQGGQSAAQQGASGRNEQMLNDQQGDRNARGRGEEGMTGRDGEGARNGSGEAAADRVGGGRYI